MFPFQCSFCGSKEQLRTTADSKNQNRLCLSLAFIAVEICLVFTKPEQIAKRPWGGVRAAGVSSVRSTSAAACCVSECAVCSFTMLHSQRRCLHPSVSETLQAVKRKTAPPSKQLPLATNPFFWMNESKCNYAVCELYNLTTLFLCL